MTFILILLGLFVFFDALLYYPFAGWTIHVSNYMKSKARNGYMPYCDIKKNLESMRSFLVASSHFRDVVEAYPSMEMYVKYIKGEGDMPEKFFEASPYSLTLMKKDYWTDYASYMLMLHWIRKHRKEFFVREDGFSYDMMIKSTTKAFWDSIGGNKHD